MKCSSPNCPNPAVTTILGREVTRNYCAQHYAQLRDAVKDIKDWNCGVSEE